MYMYIHMYMWLCAHIYIYTYTYTHEYITGAEGPGGYATHKHLVWARSV